MKTIAMDYKLLVEEVMEIDFKSEVTILDYEIVIWNPNALMENYDSKISNWDGDPLFKTYDSVLINNDTKRRERELKEFLCNNRLFICFTPKPITYNSLNEKNVWKKIEFNIFPEIISTIPARGTNIERKNGNILNEFWSTNEGQMFYEAYISNGSFEPLLFIKGTDKVVGAYKNYNKGYLFFIPTLCDESYYESIEDCREAHKSFYESVISLYKNLFKARKEIVFPEWAIKYSYLEAGAVKSELLDVEKRYNETVSELQLKQSIFNKIEEFKLLFTGTGDLLRDQVKIVFEQLGFEILGSDIGRDDIVMGYNNQPVVVEVKGVKKTATEQYAAQLEKWVAEYFTKNKIEAKGILVVNSYKDTPLIKRDSVTFPNQMIKYSRSRKHCLISSLQLLCLYLDALRNPYKKELIIEELVKTEGVYNGYENWQDYLNHEDS